MFIDSLDMQCSIRRGILYSILTRLILYIKLYASYIITRGILFVRSFALIITSMQIMR